MSAEVWMVASGKGGTGKSTTGVFCAAALAERGKQVLVIELDCGLRSVDLLAGVAEQVVFDIEDVLSGWCPPQKAICQSPFYPGVSIIAAPYSGQQLHIDALGEVLDSLKDCYDFILLDVAAGMGQAFQGAATVSTGALLVLTADPVALRDGRLASEWLYNNSSVVPRLVLNRISLTATTMDLDVCIDTVAAQLIAVIPESPQLQQTVLEQKTVNKQSRLWLAYSNLAGRICKEDIPLLME